MNTRTAFLVWLCIVSFLLGALTDGALTVCYLEHRNDPPDTSKWVEVN